MKKKYIDRQVEIARQKIGIEDTDKSKFWIEATKGKDYPYLYKFPQKDKGLK